MRKRRAKHRSVEDQRLGPSPTRVLSIQVNPQKIEQKFAVLGRYLFVCLFKGWIATLPHESNRYFQRRADTYSGSHFHLQFICEKGVQSTEVWRIRDLAQALLESFSPKKDEERGPQRCFQPLGRRCKKMVAVHSEALGLANTYPGSHFHLHSYAKKVCKAQKCGGSGTWPELY